MVTHRRFLEDYFRGCESPRLHHRLAARLAHGRPRQAASRIAFSSTFSIALTTPLRRPYPGAPKPYPAQTLPDLRPTSLRRPFAALFREPPTLKAVKRSDSSSLDARKILPWHPVTVPCSNLRRRNRCIGLRRVPPAPPSPSRRYNSAMSYSTTKPRRDGAVRTRRVYRACARESRAGSSMTERPPTGARRGSIRAESGAAEFVEMDVTTRRRIARAAAAVASLTERSTSLQQRRRGHVARC